MTIDQVKAEAKRRFGQELTDEQAQAVLKNHDSGELSAQALAEVTGGANLVPIPNLAADKMTIDFSVEIRNTPDAMKEGLGGFSTWGLSAGQTETGGKQ